MSFKRLIKQLLPRSVMIHKLPPARTKRVLLTFDDGPDEIVTPKILDILNKYGACAIFFVVGNKAEQHPDLVERIINDGHVIANHTYTHPHDKKLNFTEYRMEIFRAQKVLAKYCKGKHNRLFRPPCGELNLTTFMAAKSLRLRIVLWSNGGGEWSYRQTATAAEIAQAMLNTLSDRQIILLHDNNDKVPDILNSILPYLKNHGYDLARAVYEIR